ncbi:hypothetical protein G4X40_20265 [Rhodococcus sp. D2-41]|uniref:hypothetical protein n=1 Tax=Speluncibacter jeojiensis TaxID=2710754 RepID=UPI00240F3488|nr:hypothetical protein [Rhodococcus sp. D2-41]MDG3012478.1 hypothetical protein [Rhodococcus sp. D2-41]
MTEQRPHDLTAPVETVVRLWDNGFELLWSSADPDRDPRTFEEAVARHREVNVTEDQVCSCGCGAHQLWSGRAVHRPAERIDAYEALRVVQLWPNPMLGSGS